MAFKWTDEALNLVRSLAAQRVSSTEIAMELMRAFPGGGKLTRNAIIGKCHRKGITLDSRIGFAIDPKRAVASGRIGGQAPRTVAPKANYALGSKPARAAKPASTPNAPRAEAQTGGRSTPPAPPANLITAPEALDPEFEPYVVRLQEPFDVLEMMMAPAGYFGPTRFIEARTDQCRNFTSAEHGMAAIVCGARTIVGGAYCQPCAKRIYATAGLSEASLKDLKNHRPDGARARSA